jgi:hypothetical protein
MALSFMPLFLWRTCSRVTNTPIDRCLSHTVKQSTDDWHPSTLTFHTHLFCQGTSLSGAPRCEASMVPLKKPQKLTCTPSRATCRAAGHCHETKETHSAFDILIMLHSQRKCQPVAGFIMHGLPQVAVYHGSPELLHSQDLGVADKKGHAWQDARCAGSLSSAHLELWCLRTWRMRTLTSMPGSRLAMLSPSH